MSCPTFISDLSEAEVATILSAPEVSHRLRDQFGLDLHVTLLGQQAYQVATLEGDFVVRFPKDAEQLSLLRKEQGVETGFRESVTLLLPDTRVVDDVDGCPAFAIYRMIPGEPLTSELYAGLSPQTRRRLVVDLASFFYEAHSIPLRVACEWLGTPFEGEITLAQLASTGGKPTWFGTDAAAEIRPGLLLILDGHEVALFEDTVRRFEALGTAPGYMVFGHGDMHGYNIAMGKDHLGPKLVGAFDLDCAGILDIHEDFFRLSLVSEELLESVIATYQSLPGQSRSLKRDRIALYYRAFLFYLMVDQSGAYLEHVKRLLRKHVEYYLSAR